MLSTLLNLPCTILRRTSSGEDAYGNTEKTDVAVETLCELQQTSRDEPDGQGELGVTTWLLVLPAGTIVETGDAVVVDGHTYELVGPPWHARNPRTGLASHIEATVKRTVGTSETGS